MQDVKELRLKHVEHLRRIADEIVLSEDNVPNGVFVQVFWSDGIVTRAQCIELGFFLTHAIGVFEQVKQELLNHLFGEQRRQQNDRV